ncbi:MAG: transcription termination factor Rho, partial [Acidimicrobiales bacterium]
MSGEPQLERSVLEGKERDELHAIAEALGLKPSSRAAKATLVGQILRATGVEQDGGPPKARSPRARSSSASNGSADEAAPGAPSGNGADASSPGADEPSAQDAAEDEGQGEPGAPDEPASDNGRAPEEGRGGGQTDRDDRQARDPQGQGSYGGWQNRDQSRGGQGQAGSGNNNNNLDPANRRSRRRRGRDRERVGDRDLQGGGQEQQYSGEPVPVAGLLDLNDQGYGFLRTSGYVASPRDVYVSISQVRRFALRKGDYVEGASRPAGSSEKYPALVRIDTVSGLTPDEARVRARFEDLTPLFPDEKLRLEVPGDQSNMVSRIVDLISPIGKGQRGLIVSPPKAGKTTVLKQIAHSIEANNPEVHLMVLLVDE